MLHDDTSQLSPAATTVDPATAPILRLTGVSVHFGGVRAVDDVSFDVEPGTLYGIMGPNGSGKSTMLAAVTRLQKLTAGDIRLFGSSVAGTRPERLARLGMARTFQTTRLLDTLTVRENVALGADVHRRGRLHLRTRRSAAAPDPEVDLALERAGVTALAGRYPQELSYGDQRRVEIARALAVRPSILLLDEPTAGMNTNERNEIGGLLSTLRGQGVTQVLVEHDVPMMVGLCDRLVAMVQGRVIAVGAPEEIVADPRVREAYLGGRRAHRA